MKQNRYNPLDLFMSIIHVPSKSVFRKLKYFLLFILVYALIIILFNYQFKIFSGENELGQFHLLFSFCLAIIIGFRINIAYSRWWEARILWGNLVNNCRNLTLKLNGYINLANDKELVSYIAKFPSLLRYHLRNDIDNSRKVMDDLHINYGEQHLPNLLIQQIINKVCYYRTTEQMGFEQFLSVDPHVGALTDILGACERILNTTPPHGFSIFARFALLFYMLIFPFGWLSRFELFIIPILIVIIYVLLGLEVLAEEMETPFTEDYNALPIDQYADKIEQNVNQIVNSVTKN